MKYLFIHCPYENIISALKDKNIVIRSHNNVLCRNNAVNAIPY